MYDPVDNKLMSRDTLQCGDQRRIYGFSLVEQSRQQVAGKGLCTHLKTKSSSGVTLPLIGGGLYSTHVNCRFVACAPRNVIDCQHFMSAGSSTGAIIFHPESDT